MEQVKVFFMADKQLIMYQVYSNPATVNDRPRCQSPQNGHIIHRFLTHAVLVIVYVFDVFFDTVSLYKQLCWKLGIKKPGI